MDHSYEANAHDFQRRDDVRDHDCEVCGFDQRHPYHQTPIERSVAEHRSGVTRQSLGRRLAVILDAKAAAGEITWETTESGVLRYVITPGRMWADPKPPTLTMSPGETADWLGIPVLA